MGEGTSIWGWRGEERWSPYKDLLSPSKRYLQADAMIRRVRGHWVLLNIVQSLGAKCRARQDLQSQQSMDSN